jgi:peroxiredoxin
VELPHLENLFRKYKEQGLQIIAIDSGIQLEAGRALIEEHGLSFPVLRCGEAPESGVVKEFGVVGYPSSFLVDKNAKVCHFHFGFREGHELKLEEEIISLLPK